MTLSRRFVIAFTKFVSKLLCRVDDSQLVNVPDHGPLILVVNHTNILEVPVVYSSLMPRPVGGFSAAKNWKVWWTRWLLNAAGAIPLRRGEMDVKAMRKALEWLNAGNILAVAPEGTRSGNGRLQQGHPGVVLLAMRTGAPLLPVVFYGHEQYIENVKRLRRTEFTFVVGKPFFLETRGENVTSQVRYQMVDEIMYQMAAILPAKNRGIYSEMDKATLKYIKFQEPKTSK